MDGDDRSTRAPDSPSAAAAASRGDAIDRIVAAHGDDLRRFLGRRIGDPAERDEVVQESFLRLARYGKIDGLQNPRSFLFRIAENLMRDRQRRRRARRDDQHDPLDGQDLRDPAPDAHTILQHRDALARVTAAIAALEEPARTAFILSRYREMSYGEIADHMQVSVKSVEKYISSALAALRHAVGSDHPDASLGTETR